MPRAWGGVFSWCARVAWWGAAGGAAGVPVFPRGGWAVAAGWLLLLCGGAGGACHRQLGYLSAYLMSASTPFGRGLVC